MGDGKPRQLPLVCLPPLHGGHPPQAGRDLRPGPPDRRVAPTGITVYTGDDLPESAGSLLFCSYNEGALTRAAFSQGRLEMRDTGQPCSLDVVTGPDGSLCSSDENAIYRWYR